MSVALIGAVVVAIILCSLTAGFLFAFSVVVMPGITRLEDGAYLRAFQVIDGVIQNNSPLFIVMWVGSVVAMLSVLVLSFGSPGGPDRLLLLVAAGLYLGGVQLPTVLVNIPLNNRVQMLQIANLDATEKRAAREAFEPGWSRWNGFRTVVAVVTVVVLLIAIAPSPASGQAPTRPDANELARMDETLGPIIQGAYKRRHFGLP